MPIVGQHHCKIDGIIGTTELVQVGTQLPEMRNFCRAADSILIAAIKSLNVVATDIHFAHLTQLGNVVLQLPFGVAHDRSMRRQQVRRIVAGNLRSTLAKFVKSLGETVIPLGVVPRVHLRAVDHQIAGKHHPAVVVFEQIGRVTG